MSNAAARRGRPKGSGLDDRARLKTVAALLASNPELKTTNAIKSTGISDPSTIRRLRFAGAGPTDRQDGGGGIGLLANRPTPAPPPT